MKKIILLITALAVYAGAVQAQTPCATKTLIWSDEFDEPSLDLSKWAYVTGNGCPNLCGWGNNELETYTTDAKNVYIKDEMLVIEAVKESVNGSSFTSGKLVTLGLHTWKYGRFEARMRMPEGNGLWPAFWMLDKNNDWPMTGEIDIMEYRGDLQKETHATLHYGSPWPANQYDGTIYTHSESLADDFHIYAVEWTEDKMVWYFDDKIIKTETKSPNSLSPQSTNDVWPWDDQFYMILNLAVGGGFCGNPSADAIQMTKPTFEIDYVRVYEISENTTSGQWAYNGEPQTIPGTIELENYDEACSATETYNDLTPTNQGGEYRSDGVDIEVCTAGGYNVGYAEAGEWLEYTVNVKQAGVYSINFHVASLNASGTFYLEQNGNAITDIIDMNSSGSSGWQDWQTITLENMPLSAGEQIIRFVVETGGFNIDKMVFQSTGTTQTILLKKGWNFISTYIQPIDQSIKTLLPNAEIVKTVHSFWSYDQPEYLNSLQNIQDSEGYLVYNSKTETLSITGTAVSPLSPVLLAPGWNLVGIPVQSTYNISNLPSEITIIKDLDGFYKDGSSLNTIQTLEPGKSYFIYADTSCTIFW